MIDDIELCRKVLLIYADEEEYPTDIQFDKLCSMFPDVSRSAMMMNVCSLEEQSLLEVAIVSVGSLDKPNDIVIGAITGITPSLGSSYVREMRDDNKWRNAIKKATESGAPVMLQTVLTSLLG